MKKLYFSLLLSCFCQSNAAYQKNGIQLIEKNIWNPALSKDFTRVIAVHDQHAYALVEFTKADQDKNLFVTLDVNEKYPLLAQEWAIEALTIFLRQFCSVGTIFVTVPESLVMTCQRVGFTRIKNKEKSAENKVILQVPSYALALQQKRAVSRSCLKISAFVTRKRSDFFRL